MIKNFREAATNLAILCDYIDNGIDINDIIINEFNIRKGDATAAVDYQKALYLNTESDIKMHKVYRDSINDEIKKLECILVRIEENTKKAVLDNPDIIFRDSLGKKLSVLNNAAPKVVINDGISINQYSDYARVITKYEPDLVKIKEDLLGGAEIAWAKLEYGTQLRGLKTKAKEIENV